MSPATMPAQATTGLDRLCVRPTIRPTTSAVPVAADSIGDRTAVEAMTRDELVAALVAAQQRNTALESRNHALAADLDDALDQLSGHALHAEQERLARPAAWSPWGALSTTEKEYER